jgi:glycosyltransferase involved in cell wall biosynthesis
VRVLVLTRVFPNPAQPTYGVFVRERVRRVAERCDAEVLAPVPRFVFDRMVRGVPRQRVPKVERQGGLTVHHPSVVSIPGAAKSLDGVLYFLGLLPFLHRLRRRFAFELIDAHFGYPDGVAAVLLGRALRCPVSVTLRGNEALLVRRRLRRWQLRFALRHAQVIAVSGSLAALAQRLGAPAARVRVIPNGVDAGVFHPGDRDHARERLGLPPGRPIVVSVGNFVAGKGHERVLAMLPDLLARCPELLYVAVGNRGGRRSRLPAIRRLARSLGDGDHVRLEVARPHDEIAWWLRAADVFCLATDREGSSNALCEALACGLPVVTTHVGGNAEIVRDGLDGYLIPFFEAGAFAAALLRALDARWDRLAIAAHAAGRTWERVADEVLAAFEAAVAANRPTPPLA